jgi:hypothetical protein
MKTVALLGVLLLVQQLVASEFVIGWKPRLSGSGEPQNQPRGALPNLGLEFLQ